MRKTALLALAVFLLTAACGGPGAPTTGSPAASGPLEKASLKFGVGGQAQIAYVPLVLADQLGYFKAEGITVEINDLKAGADALKALTGGSVDVVTGFYEHTIRMQAQGKHVEMFTLFDLYPGLVLFVNKKHADARSIKDIANLSIGVTSLGSSTDEMVRYLFKENGLDPKTAKTVAVGSGSLALTALKSDTVQALVTVEPAASMLDQSGDGKAVYDTRTAAGAREVFGGSWPAGGFYTSSDFLTQNPRTAQALARVGLKALRYIHSHSADDIASHLPAQLFYPDGNKDFFVKMLTADLGMFSSDGKMTPDGPDNVLSTLKVADPTTDWSTVDLKQTYDNSFVVNVK